MIKSPTNLLYANTATTQSTTSSQARTRRVRSRVPDSTRKIGVFDISARAGFLFDVLELVSRSQSRFTFYPVEASLPMGLGVIGDVFEAKLKAVREKLSRGDKAELRQNIAVQDYFPFLKQTREQIHVDVIAGLFSPMLAWTESDDAKTVDYGWNFFSLGEGPDVAISVYGLRDYAKEAGRPFEAAVALLTLAQVWASLYGTRFHQQSRGCPFDFCENRDDLVGAISKMEICSESLEEIPADERESVTKCLNVIRTYARG